MARPNGNDPQDKVNKILSGIDPAKLQKGMEALGQLTSGKDSAKLKQQLKNVDTKKVMEMFNSMDAEEIKRKLNQADVSRLNLNDKNLWNKLK